jgi:mRNA interferase RelE/StbE
MDYRIVYMPRSLRDLDDLSPEVAQRIIAKISALGTDLAGDIKRLKHADPRYRLRVGDYRVLFNIEGSLLKIHRILHRREAYD